MTLKSIGVTEGADEQVLFDSTASGDAQCVKLIDPTASSTTGIGISANPMHVQAAALPLPSGAATSANQTTIIGHLDGVEGGLSSLLGELQLKADLTETQPISAASLPLPTGAATSALQTTGNTSLSTIAGAVTGTEMQVDVLTMPAITGSVSISGTVAVTQSGTWDEVGINDSGNSITVDNGGTFAVQAAQSGTWNITNVSGTVSLPTGAATAALQTTGNTTLSTISGTISTLDAKFPTEGTLTDDMAKGNVSQIGAFGMCYDGSTWDMVRGDSTNGLLVNLGANNDVTVTSSALPSGAATAANQTTIIGHVDGIETLLGTSNTNTGAATTALQIIDDWDESDRAKVNIIVGQAGVAAASGASSATTIRTISATDSPEVTALQILDNIVSGAGVNVTQMNGVNVTMGAGASNTGTQRVAISTDSTFTVTTTPESATTPATAPTAATVNVTTGAAVTLLASNASRKKAFVQMVGNSDVYVKMGSGAAISTGNYHLQLDSKSQYFSIDGNIYTGIITAIAAGSAIDCVVWEVV